MNSSPTPEVDSPWMVQGVVDLTIFTRVPAGRVFLGGPDHHEGGCEPFWHEVPAFYLALTPVTNAQFEVFLERTGEEPPRARGSEESPWFGRRIREELRDHPVVSVTWDQARRYADWADARLPREVEWERAARGDSQARHPWGDFWDPDRCRHDDNRGIQTTASVWSHPEGCGAWGHYQLAGNVWEWCEDPFEESAYRRLSRGLPERRTGTPLRVTRGGSWFNVSVESFRTGYRFGHPRDESDSHYGFRLALDA